MISDKVRQAGKIFESFTGKVEKVIFSSFGCVCEYKNDDIKFKLLKDNMVITNERDFEITSTFGNSFSLYPSTIHYRYIYFHLSNGGLSVYFNSENDTIELYNRLMSIFYNSYKPIEIQTEGLIHYDYDKINIDHDKLDDKQLQDEVKVCKK